MGFLSRLLWGLIVPTDRYNLSGNLGLAPSPRFKAGNNGCAGPSMFCAERSVILSPWVLGPCGGGTSAAPDGMATRLLQLSVVQRRYTFDVRARRFAPVYSDVLQLFPVRLLRSYKRIRFRGARLELTGRKAGSSVSWTCSSSSTVSALFCMRSCDGFHNFNSAVSTFS